MIFSNTFPVLQHTVQKPQKILAPYYLFIVTLTIFSEMSAIFYQKKIRLTIIEVQLQLVSITLPSPITLNMELPINGA